MGNEILDKTEHSKDDDDAALQFLDGNAAVGEHADVDEKKLMRRVDWMMMPLMFACYYLQYSDKTLSKYAPLSHDTLDE